MNSIKLLSNKKLLITNLVISSILSVTLYSTPSFAKEPGHSQGRQDSSPAVPAQSSIPLSTEPTAPVTEIIPVSPTPSETSVTPTSTLPLPEVSTSPLQPGMGAGAEASVPTTADDAIININNDSTVPSTVTPAMLTIPAPTSNNRGAELQQPKVSSSSAQNTAASLLDIPSSVTIADSSILYDQSGFVNGEITSNEPTQIVAKNISGEAPAYYGINELSKNQIATYLVAAGVFTLAGIGLLYASTATFSMRRPELLTLLKIKG